jgi:hypothetical protein
MLIIFKELFLEYTWMLEYEDMCAVHQITLMHPHNQVK